MLRAAGAKKVYLASAAPPVVAPCVYGVDMPTRKELLANQVDGEDKVEAIRKHIGADYLVYQTIEDLVDATRISKGPVKEFCTACWTKKYPTKEVTPKLLQTLEIERETDPTSAHC
jgi:amidophosphoribosyltransferase